MNSDFDRATQQIQRAQMTGLTLFGARIGPAPVLTLGECRKLSRETAYSIEQLRREFIGFEDGWEDFRQAMEDFKREVGKPCLRVVDYLARKLA